MVTSGPGGGGGWDDGWKGVFKKNRVREETRAGQNEDE